MIVAVKPLNHYIKTLVCVVDALKEFFNAAGYTVDRFILQSDNSEVKVILHYLRSSDKYLESIDQGQKNLVDAEGG